MRIKWPNNKRMAVCLSWDLDGESAAYLRYPEQTSKMLSELHQRSYGPTIGMVKILNLLDKYQLPGTFYIPAYTAAVHREITQEIYRKGHAVGLHGYIHESLDDLTEDKEEEILLKSIEIFKDILGFQPNIYRSPSWELNRWTPDLLTKHGVLSDSSLMDDEIPYELLTEKGSIIEIPIQWILDDAEYWGHTRNSRHKIIADPDTVFKIWSREFDGYYDSGGCFTLTLHPYISGRSVYMQTVEKLIKYMRQFPNIWWTDIEQMTDHCRKLNEQGELEKKESPPAYPFQYEDLLSRKR